VSLSERLARHAIGTANELEDALLEAATTIETQAAEIERLRASLARPEPSEAVVEAVAQSLGDVLSSRERYYFTDPTRNRDGSLSMSFDGEVDLTELARAAIAAYDGEGLTTPANGGL